MTTAKVNNNRSFKDLSKTKNGEEDKVASVMKGKSNITGLNRLAQKRKSSIEKNQELYKRIINSNLTKTSKILEKKGFYQESQKTIFN